MTSPFGGGSSKPAPLDILAERGASERPPAPPGVTEAPPINSLSLYLPEVFPIPGATEFAADGFVSSPGAGTIAIPGVSVQLPQSSLGIVRVFSIGLDDMTQATDVIFRLRVNQRPVPAWGAFRMFPGVAARVTASQGVWVPVSPSGVVDVVVQNVDGAVYQVGAGFSGWWWPESLDKAWRGQLYQHFGRQGG